MFYSNKGTLHRAFFFSTLFLVLDLLTACHSSQPECMLFNVNHPDETVSLPGRLKEISGICLYAPHKLACVQDEKGIIFIYDLKKNKLLAGIKFSKDRDYEGIANVADSIFVLCSNGELFKVWNLDADTIHSETIPTILTKQNNCEGLCYDKTNDRLLIACKGRPIRNTAPASAHAVYAFDLKQREVQTQPVFLIYPDSVKQLLESEGQSTRIIKESGEEIPFDFAPSELNIDPVTGDIYMISSFGKTLIVLDNAGNLKCAIRLDVKLYRQPEGLTFKSNGDLIISNEGKEGRATLTVLKRPGKKKN